GLCGAHSPGREGCGPAGRPVHEGRVRGQSENREDVGRDIPAPSHRPRRRGDRMNRRQFITLFGGAAAAWPLAARAQQPAKVPTIGFLGSGTPITAGAWVVAFAQRLRELGWIEDRTIKIDLRWAEGRNDRSVEIATDFVRQKVDVIVTYGSE